jgi:type IV secretion system protein VirB8
MTEKQTETAAEGRETYYAQAATWADDRQDALRRSTRIAWIIAGVAVAVALLEALALVALAPLKTVVPYTLLVDRTTGYAQMLKGTATESIPADEALTHSLLAQYVIARENFDIASIPHDYRKVALWSGETARRDYLSLMPATNPSSPFRLYPRTTQVTTTVRSVSPMGQGSALVRFATERRDQGQLAGTQQYWVAVIRYRYVGIPMSVEDRLVNPLGFQVIGYRRDQEAPPPTTTAPAAAAPVPGALAPLGQP